MSSFPTPGSARWGGASQIFVQHHENIIFYRQVCLLYSGKAARPGSDFPMGTMGSSCLRAGCLFPSPFWELLSCPHPTMGAVPSRSGCSFPHKRGEGLGWPLHLHVERLPAQTCDPFGVASEHPADLIAGGRVPEKYLSRREARGSRQATRIM